MIAKLSAQVRMNSMTVTATTTAPAPSCKHTNTTVTGAVEATCTTDGHSGKTVCSDCGETISEGNVITAPGHNYVDGTCTGCGEKDPNASADVTVTVSIKDYAAANGWSNSVKYTELKMDDTVTVKVSGGSNTGKYYTSGTNWRMYQTENPSIVISAGDKTIISVKITYTPYNTGALTLNGATVASGTVVDVNASSVTFSVGNTGTATNGQARITAIEVVYAGAAVPCEHTNTTITGAVDATCTTDGHSGKTVCSDCGEIISEGNVIAALDHSYANGVCTGCGEKDPNAPVITEAKLSFSDKANRTVFTTSQQVWAQNGITVTNDKAASTSNVADYANPARFYKSSKLTIAFPGMTKIVFNCNSSSYATALKDSIGTVSGATVTISGSVVTVEFASAQDTFVIAKLSAQVRMNSMTVTAATAAPACEHTNTAVEGAIEATCTTDGHTGKTVCSDCGEIISEGSVIAATGHVNTSVVGAVEATCTEAGHTGKTVCAACSAVLSEGEEIPALGHNHVDGVCTRCGDVLMVTVIFMVDGEMFHQVTLPWGTQPEMPAAPVKDGYEFDGWQIDENGVYNAKFTKIHKVTFRLPAMAGGGSRVFYVRDGETVEAYAIKDTADTAFKYWYLYEETANNNHLKAFDFSTPITADLIFQASVEAIKQTYVVGVYVTINGKNVRIGTGSISDIANPKEFYGIYNNVVQKKHYSWSNVDLGETFADIVVDGITYTYGEGSSDNYYTYTAKNLKVGKYSGKNEFYFYAVGDYKLYHNAVVTLVFGSGGTREIKLDNIAHGTVVTTDWLLANKAKYMPLNCELLNDVVINRGTEYRVGATYTGL